MRTQNTDSANGYHRISYACIYTLHFSLSSPLCATQLDAARIVLAPALSIGTLSDDSGDSLICSIMTGRQTIGWMSLSCEARSPARLDSYSGLAPFAISHTPSALLTAAVAHDPFRTSDQTYTAPKQAPATAANTNCSVARTAMAHQTMAVRRPATAPSTVLPPAS